MNNPQKGIYMAKVTDDGITAMHADEEAVFDAQTEKMFSSRNLEHEAMLREAEEKARNAARQAAKRKRRIWYTVKDVVSFVGTACLVYLTYRFGLYVAIAAIAGCLVAAGCRITNYLEKEK